MKTAGLFPGQGSEYPGMLRSISGQTITHEVFSRINEISGRDIFSAASYGTEDVLRDPLNAQLSVFGTSACYWHMLRGQTDFYGLAGHSLGFYSALYAAGSISLDDCIRIIIRVNEVITNMTNGKKGLMASVIGLKAGELEVICRESGDVFISGINSATQIVISGIDADVRKACEKALQSGALGARELPIPYTLHSPMMEGIESVLRPFISQIEIREPEIPVLSHLDAAVLDKSGIEDVLCGQLSKRVAWRDTVRYFADAGISRFLEIGPSDVLSKLVRWIERDADISRAEEAINCQGV